MDEWQNPKTNRAKKKTLFNWKNKKIDDKITDLGIEKICF